MPRSHKNESGNGNDRYVFAYMVIKYLYNLYSTQETDREMTWGIEDKEQKTLNFD